MGILMLLGMVQFSAKGSFTKQVGNLVVTGHYRSQDRPNRYALSGDARVSFGGMEFGITASRNNGFSLVWFDGKKEHILPEYMSIADKTVIFEFPGGTELSFISQDMDKSPELMIYAVLGENTAALELPYKPLRGSKIHERDQGQLVIATNGVNYHFNRFLTDEERSERQVLILEDQRSFISYRAVPEVLEQTFDFGDFILPLAQDKQNYDKALGKWRDQSFSQWSKSISSSNNEDLVIAYTGEAISRGSYERAVAAVPSAFLNGNRRTYASTVFLGRLDLGLRSLAADERDKSNRLSQLINQQSLEFLKEPHVFQYFALRGSLTLIDEGAKLVRAIDPAKVSPDLIVGILEGYVDWNRYHTTMEKTATPQNPFEGFINQIYLIISQGIKRISGVDRVFMFNNGIADMEFNLQLGKALMVYAEETGTSDWVAIGRSLVLSVISLMNESETIPAKLYLSEEGIITDDSAAPRISSAQIYRWLSPGENYPQGVSIGAPGSGIWTWTAASAIAVSQENEGLDLAVSFPVGETHYMLIRGISPPSRIQLYDIDYRTAPDFERYNSSGWSYSASERTLLVKMRHRSGVEHVKIFQ
jgi:hypothetical protein